MNYHAVTYTWKHVVVAMLLLAFIVAIGALAFSPAKHKPAPPPPPVFLAGQSFCFKDQPDTWSIVWHAYPRDGDTNGVVTYAASSGGAVDWKQWDKDMYATGTYPRSVHQVSMTVMVTYNNVKTVTSNTAVVKIKQGNSSSACR